MVPGIHEFWETIWTPKENGNIDKLSSWEVGVKTEERRIRKKFLDSQRNVKVK